MVFYAYIFAKMAKMHTNFGQNGGEFCEIWEIFELGIDMYIYSWSGRKNKIVLKNVCTSVCAQKLCTLKLKTVWKLYAGNRNCENFSPNARKLTKLKRTTFLTTLLYLGNRLMNSIQTFHTHFHSKKGILTLVRMGVKFEN